MVLIGRKVVLIVVIISIGSIGSIGLNRDHFGFIGRDRINTGFLSNRDHLLCTWGFNGLDWESGCYLPEYGNGQKGVSDSGDPDGR